MEKQNKTGVREDRVKETKAIMSEPMKPFIDMFSFLLIKQLRQLILTFTHVNNSDMSK